MPDIHGPALETTTPSPTNHHRQKSDRFENDYAIHDIFMPLFIMMYDISKL